VTSRVWGPGNLCKRLRRTQGVASWLLARGDSLSGQQKCQNRAGGAWNSVMVTITWACGAVCHPPRNASAAWLPRAQVRRGAQEAHSDSKVARARREPAPCPRHRLKPTAHSRAAHRHHAATPTLHDPGADRMTGPADHLHQRQESMLELPGQHGCATVRQESTDRRAGIYPAQRLDGFRP
jgi:hypothetical protein